MGRWIFFFFFCLEHNCQIWVPTPGLGQPSCRSLLSCHSHDSTQTPLCQTQSPAGNSSLSFFLRFYRWMFFVMHESLLNQFILSRVHQSFLSCCSRALCHLACVTGRQYHNMIFWYLNGIQGRSGLYHHPHVWCVKAGQTGQKVAGFRLPNKATFAFPLPYPVSVTCF